MSMKTILVPIEESESLPSVLETSYLVTQLFGSCLTGIYLPAPIPTVLSGDGFAGGMAFPVEDLERENSERAQQARQAFDKFRQSKTLPWASAAEPSDDPAVAWIDANKLDANLGSYGRVFDLTVVGRPLRGALTPSASTMEDALFESGRPLLIAPPKAPGGIGDTIVIAWNGSTESARAIVMSMPFLARAKKVHVLAVEGGMVPGPGVAEVEGHLRRNGISAQASTVQPGSASAGETLLAETAKLGGDLLIKGAYTHSRLRQMIFGGVTQHILNEAEIPVLMAH